MPVRAISGVGDIHAFDFDLAGWAELKDSYRSRGLRMPCCARLAVPKTSSRGLFFFAHARIGECTTAPESAEHLYLKTLIAQTAKRIGWMVATERRGESPDGDPWIADVYCEKEGVKFALEIQLSPQTLDETARRQKVYEESGIRCVWFVGPKLRQDIPSHKGMPVFKVGSVRIGQDPVSELFDVTLSEFVALFLDERVIWTKPGYTTPCYIHYLPGNCERCRLAVNWILMHANAGESGALTVEAINAALHRIFDAITYPELDTLDLCHVSKVISFANGVTTECFQNHCPKCKTPLDTRKLHVSLVSTGTESMRQVYFDRNNNGSGCWTLVSDDGEFLKHGPWVHSALQYGDPQGAAK